MGNKIKSNILLVLNSLLLSFNSFLIFLEIDYYKKLLNNEMYILVFFLIVFLLFYFVLVKLTKKSISALLHIAFVAIMPILTIMIILYIDTTFFDHIIIDSSLKLFSWDFYQGETRSRYIITILTVFFFPLLFVAYGIIAFINYMYRKN